MSIIWPPLGAPEIVALTIGAAACVTDLRARRIPNWLTFGAAVGALVYAGAAHGLSGLGQAAAGWLVGCLLFLPWYALGGMGAGDVKLLAALGAWLGPGDAVWVALYAAIAGGIFAILVSLAGGYLRQMCTNLWGLLMFWRVAGVQPMPSLTLRTAGGPRLPYALPITAGAVAMIWLR
jgi:prepilin peptidase CpaA